MANQENLNQEASMLQKVMAKLPEYTTKCKTAQLKAVQHGAYDTPKRCWCCWVINPEGQKYYAMYDANADCIKTISEEKKKSYIVKSVK